MHVYDVPDTFVLDSETFTRLMRVVFPGSHSPIRARIYAIAQPLIPRNAANAQSSTSGALNDAKGAMKASESLGPGRSRREHMAIVRQAVFSYHWTHRILESEPKFW